jgi:capsular exopolysaccharide synthesis family protein
MLSIIDTGAKALIIGADIRNPQLQRYLDIEDKKQRGLTDYLSLPNIDPEELIKSVTFGNRSFDYMASGIIPPNPTELLMNGKLDELLKLVEEKYDYIIIDTAPIALVADTLLIASNADLMLFVVRSEFTEKQHLNYIKNVVKEGKAKNIAIVLNGVKVNRSGYGYGYGYGQGDGKKKWYSYFFKK